MVLDGAWLSVTQNNGHKGVTLFHWAAFSAGILNFLLNALIWTALAANPRLLSKSQLYLFYAFSVTNCLTDGLFSLAPVGFTLNTQPIVEGFEIALEKIRAVLTLSIACERIHAICDPGTHYFMDHKKFALRICVISIVWGIFDAFFLILEDDIYKIRVHCVSTSSSGPIFHWYFLLSTIIAGVLLTVVYIVLICRLFVLREYHSPLNRSTNKNGYRQVNSLTIAVILIVLIFSVLPCSLYLYDMIIGRVIFMQWGPIVTIGYHLYGILSFFFYNMKHRDIRESLRKTFPFTQRFFADSEIRTMAYIPTGKNLPSSCPAAVEVKIVVCADDEIRL